MENSYKFKNGTMLDVVVAGLPRAHILCRGNKFVLQTDSNIVPNMYCSDAERREFTANLTRLRQMHYLKASTIVKELGSESLGKLMGFILPVNNWLPYIYINGKKIKDTISNDGNAIDINDIKFEITDENTEKQDTDNIVEESADDKVDVTKEDNDAENENNDSSTIIDETNQGVETVSTDDKENTTKLNTETNNTQEQSSIDFMALGKFVYSILGDVSYSIGKNFAKAMSDTPINIQMTNHAEKKEVEPEYKWNIPETVDDTSMIYSSNIMDKVKKTLENKNKAVALVGVPGTGKSRLALEFLKQNSDENHYKVIVFKKDTATSEFIGGTQADTDNGWKYADGIFMKMCKLADQHRDEKFYIVIDELTRANAEAVLGEAITAMCFRDRVFYTNNNKTICVPSNLYIIGIYNTLDSSTRMLDEALAQRFDTIRVEPQWSKEYIEFILKHTNENETQAVSTILKELFDCMRAINDAIADDIGPDYVIGTRCITIDNYTVESIKDAITNNVIYRIENAINSMRSRKDDVIELMELIKQLVE